MYKVRKINESPGSVMREYEVYWEKDDDVRIIASIPRYYKNPKGIAEGIAKSLNERNIILNLEI